MYALRSRGGKGLQVSKDVSDKYSSFVESSTSNVAKKLNRKRKLEVKIECPTEFEDESKEKLARNTVPAPKWIPMHWRAQLENIKAMRSSRDAPVDTVGCSMLADKDVLPEVHRYQVLISLMLSSQTKDQVVAEAMGKLKDHGLSIETVRETPLKDIEQMIYPVGFWKRKAVYIKNTTELLAKNYNGDIPSTLEELVSAHFT
jgi:endonuclease-3